MNKVPEKARNGFMENESSFIYQIFHGSLVLICGIIMIPISIYFLIYVFFPLAGFCVGAAYGFSILTAILASPIRAALQKVGFSEAWVEKAQTSVIGFLSILSGLLCAWQYMFFFHR